MAQVHKARADRGAVGARAGARARGAHARAHRTQADGASLPMKELRKSVTRVAVERGIDEKAAKAAFASEVRCLCGLAAADAPRRLC